MCCVNLCVRAFFFATAFLFGAVVVQAQDQTNVDQAKHMVNEQGVPQLSIDGVGMVTHPAWTALYALAYAGVEDYDPNLGLKPDAQNFAATVKWLKNNLTQEKKKCQSVSLECLAIWLKWRLGMDGEGLFVWQYHFDSTYNDVAIKAPWGSAFAQAVGIQALLAHWRQTGDQSSLDAAKRAAEPLFVPLSKGGFLFSSGQDIWFEEIPSSTSNPSHILNGHMRVLLALGELKDATGDARYQEWFSKGTDTLLRWLPSYDAGYWLRYDLNPRKEELLFRLANPYGFANPKVAIDRIVLRDPVSGKESVLDVGSENDATGALRIAGNDWGQIEQIDGHSVRRLRPVTGEREARGSSGQMVAPYSYFYLKLPDEWKDNLRNKRLELVVEYLDEQPGNLEVQMRSIAPDSTSFRAIPDGELLLTGEGNWRKWRVPVRSKSLGYWVGMTYGRKHAEYLSKIASRDARFLSWKDISSAYVNAAQDFSYVNVESASNVVPEQTPILPWYSMDANGVLLMHVLDRDEPDGNGSPVYSPFIVATQAMEGAKMPGLDLNFKKFNIDRGRVEKAPALEWLLDSRNQFDANGAVVYKFDFLNVYNDVVTPAPWQSSFGQTYVMKALLQSIDQVREEVDRIRKVLRLTLKAYSVDVDRGGLAHADHYGGLFFEEVPNRTHVLNAQLSAIPVIDGVAAKLDDAGGHELAGKGVVSLLENLNKFDTGYWLRYDLNPKKEIMFQLDWLKGNASPLIESIAFEAPQFAKQVVVNVGSEKSFVGSSRISGLEWSPVQTVEGRQVRPFANGYLLHQNTVKGGTRHNVYALMQLPEAKFSDYFDVQPHRLVIRFKDIAVGQFVVKVQSINEGNMLDFVPLRNAIITTTGDQQWKEAVVEVRPQDMGWYKGADYQVFEVGQLELVAKLTGDWFFEQYAQRQRYFLDAKAKGQAVIVQPAFKPLAVPVTPSILNASPTYDGFGFENALDGDPNDDYVASIENVALEYVSLKLNAPVLEGSLRLRWESHSNYAGNVRVVALDAHGAVGQELAQVDLQNGKDVEVQLSSTQAFQLLRIEFSKFVGQPRLLLRQLELFSKDADAGGQDDYLSVDSSLNPLRNFQLPITRNIKSLSDRLVGNIGGGHEKIIRLMNYAHDYQVGISKDISPDGIIKERVASCGNFTVLLLALASAQGLEGRVVNLYNYPKGFGHTVAEIFVDGKWRLYDPTFEGYYFYADDSERKAISFSEIVEGYSSGRSVEGYFANRRDGFDKFTGEAIYLHAQPKGVVGPSNPMLFPLYLDLKSRSIVKSEEFGSEFQGATFVGVADTNQNQSWVLTGLRAGETYSFSVRPRAVGGKLKASDEYFELVAIVNGERRTRKIFIKNPLPWGIKFVASGETQEIELRHDYAGDDFFYVSFSEFEVSRI